MTEPPMEGLVTMRMGSHIAKDGKGKMARSKEMFRCPPLTTAEKAYLLRKAVASSEELVEYAHTLKGPVTWHYTGKFKNIQMYRGEGPAFVGSASAATANGGSSGNSSSGGGGKSLEYLCGVTTMMGKLEEVAAFFDQDTTDKMKERKTPDVADCAVLYQLTSGEDMTNKSFRAFVKYLAVDFPLKGIRKRDFCYIEGQTTFRHTSGRRGWVLSMHSIKLPYFPEVEGVVRASFYHSGYVFVEAERPGYLDVMHSLQVNFKGNMRLPHFVLNYGLKRRIAGMVDVSRFIKAKRAQGNVSYRKVELVPKHLREFCYVCSRKFTLFNRKTRCRICGEVVCQPCAPRIQWDAGEQGVSKLRVCHICSENAFKANSPQQQQTDSNGGSARDLQTSKASSTEDDPDDEESRHVRELARKAAQGLGDDEDDDNLEVQTSRSVFAPERFTSISSASSMFRNQNQNKRRESGSTTVSIPIWDSVREEEDPVYEGINLSYHSKASDATATSHRSHSRQHNQHQRKHRHHRHRSGEKDKDKDRGKTSDIDEESGTVVPLVYTSDCGVRSFDKSSSCELNPHSLRLHEMQYLKKASSLTTGEHSADDLKLGILTQHARERRHAASRRKKNGSTPNMSATTTSLSRQHQHHHTSSNSSTSRHEQQIKQQVQQQKQLQRQQQSRY